MLAHEHGHWRLTGSSYVYFDHSPLLMRTLSIRSIIRWSTACVRTAKESNAFRRKHSVRAGHGSVGTRSKEKYEWHALPLPDICRYRAYRNGSEQVWSSGKGNNLCHFDMKINFPKVHQQTLTLASSLAKVLILATACSTMASCDDIEYQHFQNGYFWIK